ncbi:ABC transporter permease [Glycomyces artemisiae]|uniref:Putative ABC transport system permease protein n=1 Tax=Glycomyces artemisiae TaxID=1076443 RepID=A0A2T0UQ22_9ACTN|nr:ABC transporter permease [Glycomyces artemisiae]PRY60004.1 putative ABC transport system permease protein [Glycomyces artemisiae]
MGLRELLRFAAAGVIANKLRSSLTVLGVLIGVASVILLVGVGTASQQSVQESIESLGSGTLTVSASGGSGTRTEIAELDLGAVEAIDRSELTPDVAGVSPVVNGTATAVWQGAEYEIASVVGSDEDYLDASNYEVSEGTGILAEDVAEDRRVLVIGSTVAAELFGGDDALGQRVTLGAAVYTVVGVLAESDSGTGFSDANDIAVAPVGAVRDTLTGYGALSQILVQAADSDAVDAASAEVGAVLDDYYAVADGDTAPYQVQNASDLLETQEDTAETFTLLLGAVAAISLLVGGIGITNIMLVSVTERTREIGIRKALGAPRRVILTQFLAEATALSLIGGGLGVALAYLLSNFSFAGYETVIVPSSVGLALGVSVAIGLFFGGYPASRAAKLRPIDALRYE